MTQLWLDLAFASLGVAVGFWLACPIVGSFKPLRGTVVAVLVTCLFGVLAGQ